MRRYGKRNVWMTALAATAAFLVVPAMGQSYQMPEPPKAQSSVVIITKPDIAKAVAESDSSKKGLAKLSGDELSMLAAVRAGDDRINVDVQRAIAPGTGIVSHDVLTEVYYILDGSGDLEFGGVIPDAAPMAVDGKPLNPADLGPGHRGMKVEGSSIRHVGAGDVVMIPPNTPHRFKSIDGPITFLLVRVNPGYEKGR